METTITPKTPKLADKVEKIPFLFDPIWQHQPDELCNRIRALGIKNFTPAACEILYCMWQHGATPIEFRMVRAALKEA